MDEDEIAYKAKQAAGMDLKHEHVAPTNIARRKSSQRNGRQGKRQRANERWPARHQEERQEVKED